ncbi:MAG: hypothetical protein HYV09_27310 [Deltaproteobacteria bacterium]|nr:hypothetical protein [Deltaproteobacteria bacterium]
MKTFTFTFTAAFTLLVGCSATDGTTEVLPGGGGETEATAGGDVVPSLALVPPWSLEIPPLSTGVPLPGDPGTLTPGIVIEIADPGAGTGDGTGSGTDGPITDGTGDGTGTGTGTGTDGTGGDSPITDGTGTTQDPGGVIVVPEIEVFPREVPGNPTCAELFQGSLEIRIESAKLASPKGGTYTSADGSASVTITLDGNSFSYTSTGTIVGVIVKGGPGAQVYDGSQTEALTTPDGEAISHLLFCYLP